jgi:molybdopterin-containing oxidoreductase family membrane subunit
MTEQKLNTSQGKPFETMASELYRTVNLGKGFKIWMAFLIIAFAACMYAYTIQLREGLGVAGIRDYVSWGMYIANFVFFVATSLIGMLISAVVGFSGQKWVTPVTRIAEIIAIAFAAVAGLVIVSDMGRPDRLPYVFLYGRVQSPILWDITVITTYVVMSILLLYLPLIPDLALGKKHLVNAPKWLVRVYDILSLGYSDSVFEKKTINRSIRFLLILIIPVALAIHTVTSWLFAATPRVGWDSTIFGPYFVTGAFVSGTAAVIVAMYFFRRNYKLHDYITLDHFEKMGRLLILVSLVYLYFNINEFIVPGYKLKKFEAVHLEALFTGHHALMFWLVQICGLIIPIVLLLIKAVRKPLPMLIISLFVILGAWFKRYIIVVPTQEHPFLPIQHVPDYFKVYTPTLIETAITMASILLVIIIITVLSKIFPIIPVAETAHEHGIDLSEEFAEINNPEKK